MVASRVVGVALQHQFVNLVLVDCESQFVLFVENLHDHLVGGFLAVLVEEHKALLGFLEVATFVPSVRDHVLAKGHVHTVASWKVQISPSHFVVDLSLGQSVEAEVVEYVFEMCNRDHASLFSVVESKSL
jgi:hypothetical protein